MQTFSGISLSVFFLLIGYTLIGLIFPKIFFWNKNVSRKKNLKQGGISIGITFLIIIIGGIILQPINQDTTVKDTTVKDTTTKEITKKNVIDYKIIHKLENVRYDNGVIFYALIKEIDTANDNFKSEIMAIVKTITKEKGRKINIEIFDNEDVLELTYQDRKLTLNRMLTVEEEKEHQRHYVATFSGELKTGLFLNTLMFFTAASTEHPIIGKYVDAIEFNP